MASRSISKPFRRSIFALGGPAELSRDLGYPVDRVKQWAKRDVIPPSYWPQLVALARRKRKAGITLKRFAEASAAKMVRKKVNGAG